MRPLGSTLDSLAKVTLICLMLSLSISKSAAQSKCDKVCSNDFTCSSGKCILTVSPYIYTLPTFNSQLRLMIYFDEI